MRKALMSAPFFLAALCLGLAMILPMTGSEARVVLDDGSSQSSSTIKVSSATFAAWGMDDPAGGRQGGYWKMAPIHDPQGPMLAVDEADRGDLAKWLGPAMSTGMALTLTAGVTMGHTSRRLPFGFALAAVAVLLLLVSWLVDDLNGLPPRISAEAQAAYLADHPGTSGVGDFHVTGENTGYFALILADLFLMAGATIAWFQRPDVGDSPLPSLAD